MKRLAVIAGILIILIVSGGLTAQLTASRGEANLLPVLRTVDNPDGSTLALSPWQGEQLVLLVGFLVFNVIGMAVTIAVVMWLLHRFSAEAKASPKPSPAATMAVEKKARTPAEAVQKT